MNFPIKTQNLHHAYVLEGEKKNILPRLLNFIERELSFPTQANPDFLLHNTDSFGIEDARILKERHFSKPVSYDKKIFVASFNSPTREAQNALLKILEEPSGDTHFFFIVPSRDYLLDTIISRVEVIRRDVVKEGIDLEEAKTFLKRNSSERLELVSEIIKDKDSASAGRLLDRIEQILDEELHDGGGSAHELKGAVENIMNMRPYLRSRSASTKMIMEHLCLTLPILE